ncbi:MAG: hypothetical protein JXR46_11715, partial [Calditrichaceae bacterium]|nr:hypothetical protein [Calditrichaceae bacterium]
MKINGSKSVLLTNLKGGSMLYRFNFLSVLLIMLVSFSMAISQTARLQVIHNAADPAADTVDIYLNEDLLLN